MSRVAGTGTLLLLPVGAFGRADDTAERARLHKPKEWEIMCVRRATRATMVRSVDARLLQYNIIQYAHAYRFASGLWDVRNLCMSVSLLSTSLLSPS